MTDKVEKKPITKGRLTRAVRSHIIRAIRAESYDIRQKEFNKSMEKLAGDIRVNFLGKHLKAFESLPVELTGVKSTFYVDLGGYTFRVSLGDYEQMWSSSVNSPRYDSDHEFSKRYWNLKDKVESDFDEWSNLLDNLNGILNGTSSIKTLIEGWPEAVNYLPTETVKPKSFALAISPDKINCLISHAKGEEVDCSEVKEAA